MKTKQTASVLPILIYMFKKHPLYRVPEAESYSSYSSGSLSARASIGRKYEIYSIRLQCWRKCSEFLEISVTLYALVNLIPRSLGLCPLQAASARNQLEAGNQYGPLTG